MDLYLQKLLTYSQEINPYILIGGSLSIIYITSNIFRNMRVKRQQQKMVEQARQYRRSVDKQCQELEASLPDCQIGKELQERILNASVVEIKQMLDQQLFTSVQLLQLFTKRALTVGKELNVYTLILYKEALKQAQHCDQLRRQSPQQCKGELFGVVMSVKDSFDIAGCEANLGCISKMNRIPQVDGFNVQILKNSGAIIFMKTNVPQSLMSYECYNRIHGQTRNSWSNDRSAGGSSGGEGVSIGARVSPVGIGSDIGGSIRQPAGVNGITGLKPTFRRLPIRGHGVNIALSFSGAAIGIIPGTMGPMGKYVEDSTQVVRALLNPENQKPIAKEVVDHEFVIKPFDEELYTSKKQFKVGYFKSISSIPAAAVNQRAVEESVEALRKQGHQVVEIELPYADELPKYWWKCMCADGAQGMADMIGEEEPCDEYKMAFAMKDKTVQPKFMQFMMKMMGQSRISEFIGLTSKKTTYQYEKMCGEIYEIRQKVIADLRRKGIDAVICPIMAIPNGFHNHYQQLSEIYRYLLIFNVLDFPCGVVPVTVVREDEQNYTDHHNDLITKGCQAQMQNSVGLPVGVQVASYPMQEEICLNLMKQIETQVQFHKNHPYKH